MTSKEKFLQYAQKRRALKRQQKAQTKLDLYALQDKRTYRVCRANGVY